MKVPAAAAGVTFLLGQDQLNVQFVDARPSVPPISFRRSRAPLLKVVLDDAVMCQASPTAPRLRFLAEIDAIAGGAPFLAFGQARTEMSLYRAVDGSLILRWSRRSMGIVLVVPYGREVDAWLRFRPVKSAAGKVRLKRVFEPTHRD